MRGYRRALDPELFPSATPADCFYRQRGERQGDFVRCGADAHNYARIIADFKYFSEIMSNRIQGTTEEEKE